MLRRRSQGMVMLTSIISLDRHTPTAVATLLRPEDAPRGWTVRYDRGLLGQLKKIRWCALQEGVERPVGE
jgi:hypothetical protein